MQMIFFSPFSLQELVKLFFDLFVAVKSDGNGKK